MKEEEKEVLGPPNLVYKPLKNEGCVVSSHGSKISLPILRFHGASFGH